MDSKRLVLLVRLLVCFLDHDGLRCKCPCSSCVVLKPFSILTQREQATAHIAEEIQEPEKKAAWAISLAMAFTYIVGWLFTIVLCFVMGNPTHDINSPFLQPVAQIFYDVLGKAGGITFTCCAIIILMFVCFTAEQALARTFFAFSRDNLLPFSRYWTKISPLTGTPLNAVWISTILCIAINLIGLGSYIAIAGVFNVCAIALDWSYCKVSLRAGQSRRTVLI